MADILTEAEKNVLKMFDDIVATNQSDARIYRSPSEMMANALANKVGKVGLKTLSDPGTMKIVMSYDPAFRADVAHHIASEAIFDEVKLQKSMGVLSDPEFSGRINSSYGRKEVDVMSSIVNMSCGGGGKGGGMKLMDLLDQYTAVESELHDEEDSRRAVESIYNNLESYESGGGWGKISGLVDILGEGWAKETFRKHGAFFVRQLFEFVPEKLDGTEDDFGTPFTWVGDTRYKARNVTRDEAMNMSLKLTSDGVYRNVKSAGRLKSTMVSELLCSSARMEFLYDKERAVDRTIEMISKIGYGRINKDEMEYLIGVVQNDLQDIAGGGGAGMEAVRTYMELPKILPRPSRENVANYARAAEEVLEGIGLPRGIDIEFKLKILREMNLGDIKAAAKMSREARSDNVKMYSVGGRESNEISYTKSEVLTSSTIAVIGSFDKSRDERATKVMSDLAGKETVARARLDFKTKHKNLLPSVVRAYNGRHYTEALEILKSAREESISDVVSVVEGKEVEVRNPNVMVAYETRDPLKFDSDLQNCCVYLPQSADDKKDVMKYCKNPKFTLVLYEIDGKGLGSAICYMDSGVFLVDSVEGNRKFRKEGVFKAVYQDLLWRANNKGANKLVFGGGDGLFNVTPKAFVEYLESSGVKKSVVLSPSSKAKPTRVRGAVTMDLRSGSYIETRYKKPVYLVDIPRQ